MKEHPRGSITDLELLENIIVLGGVAKSMATYIFETEEEANMWGMTKWRKEYALKVAALP